MLLRSAAAGRGKGVITFSYCDNFIRHLCFARDILCIEMILRAGPAACDENIRAAAACGV